MNELLKLTDKLAEDLEEAHADELSHDHFGDDPKDCSYCRHIAEAKAILNKHLKKPTKKPTKKGKQ